MNIPVADWLRPKFSQFINGSRRESDRAGRLNIHLDRRLGLSRTGAVVLRDLCAGEAAGGRRHRGYFRGPLTRRDSPYELRELREPGRTIIAPDQGVPAPADKRVPNSCRPFRPVDAPVRPRELAG